MEAALGFHGGSFRSGDDHGLRGEDNAASAPSRGSHLDLRCDPTCGASRSMAVGQDREGGWRACSLVGDCLGGKWSD